MLGPGPSYFTVFFALFFLAHFGVKRDRFLVKQDHLALNLVKTLINLGYYSDDAGILNEIMIAFAVV